MSLEKSKFELGRHETFPLREGWLSKGMERLRDTGSFEGDLETADALGIGRNMAKSLRYWMEATGIANRAEGGRLEPSALNPAVAGTDPHFEYSTSTWFIHLNLARRPASVWNWFFNDFRGGPFDRETCVEALMRHIRTHASNKTTLTAVQREIGCTLLAYSSPPANEKIDPEDYTVSPLRQLGLVVRHADTGRYEKTSPLDDIPVEAFLACVDLLCRDADTESLALSDLISRRNSPGRLLNSDGDTIDRLCRRAADLYSSLGVHLSLLGSTRTITMPRLTPVEWYSRHFARIGVRHA
jgi:hypothetical protein